MLQALLFYRGLKDYYEAILSNSFIMDLSDEERSEAKERLYRIATGIHPLANALQLALPRGSTSADMVDFLISF